jgi:hypothetical protein
MLRGPCDESRTHVARGSTPRLLNLWGTLQLRRLPMGCGSRHDRRLGAARPGRNEALVRRCATASTGSTEPSRSSGDGFLVV